MSDVVTFTPNPALDVRSSIARVTPDHKMRCETPMQHPGGGGVNVARVLHRLGAKVTAVYTSGGATGERHHRLLHLEGVRSHVVPITQETRESFSVFETNTGSDYRFVLPGPRVQTSEWQAALTHLRQHWPKRFLVLSGGLAPGMPEDLYAQLVREAQAAGVPVVIDSNGEPLSLALQTGGVALFKPSLRELQQLTGEALANDADIARAAQSLIAQGQAQRVAVSLGEAGAMLVTAQEAWRAQALSVPVRTTIGAGDSFVAGMLWAWLRHEPAVETLRWAVAASAAALLAPGTALCQSADVHRLRPEVQIAPV